MDILARQRQIIGSSADWAAFNLVVGDGELAWERAAGDTIKFKVSDGVRQWSALPYVAVGGGAGNVAFKGETDMVANPAPSTPTEGDLWRSTTNGTAHASWGTYTVQV